MKYILRLVVYLAIFFLSFSVFAVLVTGIVPVTVTPLKFVRLFGNEDFGLSSKWVSLDRISEPMVRAAIASEDGEFLSHYGFNFKAIRKAIEEHKKGKRLRGASTVSQQTAKNVFCFPSRSWFRKGVESWFTVLIETFWSKERIMEVYLNIAETGIGMYGVEVAAQKFYSKPASELNTYEAAMIITAFPNPRVMSIARPSAYMNARAAHVRRNMANLGKVDIKAGRRKNPKE